MDRQNSLVKRDSGYVKFGESGTSRATLFGSAVTITEPKSNFVGSGQKWGKTESHLRRAKSCSRKVEEGKNTKLGHNLKIPSKVDGAEGRHSGLPCLWYVQSGETLDAVRCSSDLYLDKNISSVFTTLFRFVWAFLVNPYIDVLLHIISYFCREYFMRLFLHGKNKWYITDENTTLSLFYNDQKVTMKVNREQ